MLELFALPNIEGSDTEKNMQLFSNSRGPQPISFVTFSTLWMMGFPSEVSKHVDQHPDLQTIKVRISYYFMCGYGTKPLPMPSKFAM